MVKIPLNISHRKTFQDIALLVDKPDFQEKIPLLLEEAKKEKGHKTLAEYLHNAKLSHYAATIVINYKYPLGFIDVVNAVGSKGFISDKDVKNCYLKALVIPPDDNNISYTVPFNVITIFISPYTLKGKNKELRKIIAEQITELSKKITPLPQNHPLMLDIKPSFETKRDIYWDHKLKNDSIESLAGKYNYEPNTIDKSLSEYAQLLNY